MTFGSQSMLKGNISWAVDALFQLININTILCSWVNSY